MVKFIKPSILFIILFSCSLGLRAQDESAYREFKKRGDEYFNTKRYFGALDLYRYLEKQDPTSVELKYNIGRTLYHTNDLDGALKYLKFVEKESGGGSKEELYLYLAKVYHERSEFESAVEYYKNYLRQISDSHELRRSIKDVIRRCAFGMRNTRVNPKIIVQNLGNKVNSKGDDFAPVMSPNYDDKLYFSSSREEVLGGRRNEEGLEDEKLGSYNSDMFSTTIINGEWSGTRPLSYLLNSPRNDIILDFNRDGSVLYFFKGFSRYSGDILVDTFKRIEEKSLYSDKFKSPVDSEKGDVCLQVFNDSTLLFSSRREGGYGGLDLYICRKKNGLWEKPVNLGPIVNSVYDDTTPFLSKNGRTLYFSSNRSDRSLGGYDILKATYVDAEERWSQPENPGLPLNSAGDDLYFRLSENGMKAYFSSNRKEGSGESDIYAAYFQSFQQEQADYSLPATFIDVPEFKVQLEIGKISESRNVDPGNKTSLKKYVFEPMFYRSNEAVLTNDNKSKLNKVIEFLSMYPESKILLTGHSDDSDPENFDIFFSIKRIEQYAAYLESKGIQSSRIWLRGCGKQYPIAKNYITGHDNQVGKRLNRRVDLTFSPLHKLPVRINYNNPTIQDYMKSGEGTFYESAVEGLSYKVKVASIPQMYVGELLRNYKHGIVERNMASDLYHYSIGLYQTFEAALQFKKLLNQNGIKETKIIAYINGIPLDKEYDEVLVEKYADLANFYTALKAETEE